MAPRKKMTGPEIPDRVIINSCLTRERINNYWKVLNMSQKTWLEVFTPAQRYEAAINDLLDKLDEADKILEGLDD